MTGENVWYQAKWVSLAILSQVLWGGYSLLARYLQQLPGKISPFALLSALLAVATFTVLLDLMRLLFQSRAQLRNTGNAGFSFETLPIDDEGSETAPATSPIQPLPEHPLSPWPPSYTTLKNIALYSALTCARMTSNIVACGLTYAYLNAMVMLFQPFIVAVAERVLFGQQLPPFLWLALLGTTLGSAMVICGGGVGESSKAESAVSWHDIAGVALQFVSVCFSSAGRLTVRATKKIATRHELMLAQFGFTSLVLALGSMMDSHSWAALGAMPWEGWVAFLMLSIGVYVLGQMLNIECVRALSATLLSSLSSLRLVVASIGSAYLLSEPLALFQWCGTLIIMGFLLFYVHAQYRNAQQEDQQYKPVIPCA
ncbi:hypothetical protein CYMTET_8666 [Cymbomonas tetramitiformis]|uniref:Uncharacterized protein n=1 Tax=Cymbomonas tetramitiformis TaxID=36881 RepID=A0AAE0GT31_9CHLO|nr:hypothetical protein CYMTET_8666 [Cymbomonas tetramitiformis]